jgi:hypothetical protein
LLLTYNILVSEAMPQPVQPFKNLYILSKEFAAHNFDAEGNQAGDPGLEVKETFRQTLRTQTWNLFPVLSYTLAQECFDAFLRHYRGPATLRDYVLSKLYQFFIHAFAERYENPRRILEEALATAFPADSDLLTLTPRLDWEAIFIGDEEFPMVAVVENLNQYLPTRPSPQLYSSTAEKQHPAETSAPAARAKRGRPSKIPDDLKEEALQAKDSGKSNKHCAAIIYQVRYPTLQQAKNASTILREYRKKRDSKQTLPK